MTGSEAQQEGSQRVFGPLLCAARQAAGLSQKEAARRSRVPQARISRMERDPPAAMPTPEQARALVDLYELDGDDQAFIIDAAERHKAERKDTRYHVMRGNVLTSQRLFTLLEEDTRRLRAFSGGVVPGSAQTPRYIAAIMGEPDQGGPATWQRLPRRAADPANSHRRYELILTEAAAIAAIGSDEVMAEQFEDLVHIAGLPNVDLRIITRGSPVSPWRVPAMTIYDDGPVILGQIDGYARFDHPADVSRYVAEFERLHAAAATGDAAHEALAGIAHWYRSRRARSERAAQARPGTGSPGHGHGHGHAAKSSPGARKASD